MTVHPVFTIGHSTLDAEDFLGLLARHRVGCVVDVRAHPGSRRVRHFDGAALGTWLPASGVGYVQVPQLGGRRRPAKSSPNRGWTNDSFRAYADHMASAEFAAGLERLMEMAERRRAAMMCAEALWWRCHRRLVADALVARGLGVHHIGPDGRATAHELTSFAVVDGTRISYPPRQASLEVGGS